MSDDRPVVAREIQARPVDPPGKGYYVSVQLLDQHGLPNGHLTWAFAKTSFVTEVCDYVRGEVPETDGTPVMYIGDSFGNYYYTSSATSGIDVDVLEWLVDKGLALIEGVDGGWESWEGRPEFSDKYVDFREAEVVNVESIIDERRDD